MKIGLVYGSTTGNTEDAGQKIQEAFQGQIEETLEICNIELATLTTFDVLIIGISTWNIGELQQDWDDVFEDLGDLDFSGKRVLFFGLGDQVGYSENFQDAMGIVRERIVERGGDCSLGHWPTEGYDFTESLAVVDGKFCGLSLDEDNQDDQTEARIDAWCAQIQRELGLSVEAS